MESVVAKLLETQGMEKTRGVLAGIGFTESEIENLVNPPPLEELPMLLKRMAG